MSKTCCGVVHFLQPVEEDSLQKRFNELINSCNEYCGKSKAELLALKSQIILFLKSYSPIKTKNFKFESSERNPENRSIIVEYELQKFQQFSLENKTNWMCMQCSAAKLLIFGDIVFSPLNHGCNLKVKKQRKKAVPFSIQTSSEESDQKKIEEIYSNLAANFAEYTSEAVTQNFKEEIFKILKTHHPLKLANWRFGLSFSLKEKGRIITIESESNPQKARVYGKAGNRWYCYEKTNKTCAVSRTPKFFNGILFVPLNHGCKEKDLDFVLKVQDLLQDGNKGAAWTLTKTEKTSAVPTSNQPQIATFSSEMASSESNSKNPVNVQQNSTAENFLNENGNNGFENSEQYNINPSANGYQNVQNLGNEFTAEKISTENSAVNFLISGLKRSFEEYRNGNDEIQLELPNHQQSQDDNDNYNNDDEIPAKRPKFEVVKEDTVAQENLDVDE